MTKQVVTMDMLQADNSSCHHGGGGDAGPTYVGFICAGVAVLFFGSNFVPVKKFETGDGNNNNIYLPQGKVMFSQVSVCLSTIVFMATRSLLIRYGAVGTPPTRMLSSCILKSHKVDT